MSDLSRTLRILADKIESCEGKEDIRELADYYAAASWAKSELDDLRKDFRDEILDQLEDQGFDEVRGYAGTVRAHEGMNRYPLEEDVVLGRFEGTGVNYQQLASLDGDKVSEAAEATGVDEESVLNISRYKYLRRSNFDPSKMGERR